MLPFALVLGGIGALCFGIVGSTLPIRHASRTRYPMLAADTVLGLLLGVVLSPAIWLLSVLLSPLFRDTHDLSALAAGAATLVGFSLRYGRIRYLGQRRAAWRAEHSRGILGNAKGSGSTQTFPLKSPESRIAREAKEESGETLQEYAQQKLLEQLASGAITQETYLRLIASLQSAARERE